MGARISTTRGVPTLPATEVRETRSMLSTFRNDVHAISNSLKIGNLELSVLNLSSCRGGIFEVGHYESGLPVDLKARRGVDTRTFAQLDSC